MYLLQHIADGANSQEARSKEDWHIKLVWRGDERIGGEGRGGEGQNYMHPSHHQQ